jgi:regulator of RNase E activity RraA
MKPEFQCLAGMLSPSHAFVHLVDFGKAVDVFGLNVRDGDIVHADRHGAVAIRPGELEQLPAAIDLMARREKCILDAAKQPGFNVEKLRAAFTAMDQVK